MHHSNLIGKENRLIYRMASDFEDQTRYTTRVAQANADAQAQTHQEALSRNQQTAATQQAAAGNLAGAAYYSNAAESLKPQQQGMVDQYGQPTSAGILDQARQSTQGAISYNQTTGQTTPQLQFGDGLNAAIKGTNLPSLQADRLRTLESGGDWINPTWSPEQQAAVRAANANEAAALRDTLATNAKNEGARAGRNSANTAAGSKAKTTPKPVKPSKVDSVATMLDGVIAASGDPMGQVYKEMILQDLADKESAEMNADASLEGSLDRADDQHEDTMAFIDKYIDLHKANNDKLTTILDQTRDDQQKYLAEQEQRDMDRLAWEGDREQEKMARQKTAQLLSQSIQNALGGGAFSGAASEQLASTEREWDNAISSLAAEYSFKKADVSAFYKQKYIDTNNQFNLDIFNASKALDEKIEGYSIQGFNSLQARENAKTAAYAEHSKTIAEAKKTYSDNIKGYVKEIGDTLREEKRLKAADLKAQSDREWQERKFYENMDYQYDKQADAERRNALKLEKADEKLVRAEFTRISESPTVKDYATIRNNSAKARKVLEEAAKNGQLDQSVAKEVIGVLYEKVLDPTSVVRAEEYKRAGLAQNVYKKAEQAISILEGGDLTGLSQDLINSFMETIEVMSGSQKESAQAEFVGVINRMVEFNATSEAININPATLSLPAGIQIPEWATKAYFEDQESSTSNSYEVNWDDESTWDAGGGESDFGDALVSLGRTTQDFNTPIASKANGGLYDPSTVAAWGGKHAGLDLAVPQGSKFSSLIDGEIVDFGYTDGWGGTIVVRDTRGAEHRISHLSELSPELTRGAKIKRGQVIAKTGGAKGTKGAGNSTGAHIDYRVRYGGAYVDPLTYSPNV